MTVTVACPSCSRTATIAEAHLGRAGRCKHCGRRFALSIATADPPPTSAPTSLPPKVARFQVRGRLGAGAFGTVYRAYDPHLDREVALKVPQAGVLDSSRRVERFLREARAAARLRHPHIVPVHDAGKDGDQYYIASAFIEGQTLADAIPETGLKPSRVARILRALAEALAYAHALGIVHRDVKPANVMLDPNDQPHLMDFGLAARQDSAEKLTHDGALLGTPAYMAPEQAKGQQGEALPASDQYSLGVMLYELLTGRTPFEGPPAMVLYHAVNTEPPTPRSLRRGLPRDLETVCLKAMAKRPEDRYPNCQALADDLRRWLEGEPIGARRLGTGERLVRWARKNPAVAVLSAAVVLALALGVATASAFAVQARSAADRAEKEAANALAAAGRERLANDQVRAEAELARKAQIDAEAQKKLAEQRAEEARKARDDAEMQKLLAEQKAEEARQAQKAAEQALAAATTAEQKAALSDASARREGYFRIIGEAQQLVDKKDYDEAGKKLQLCLADQRGWEWRLLDDWVKRRKPPFTDFQMKSVDISNSPRYDHTHAYDAAITRTALISTRFPPGDGVVSAWDVVNQKELVSFAIKTAVEPNFATVSPDGNLVIMGSGRVRDEYNKVDGKAGVLRLWDIRTGKDRPIAQQGVGTAYQAAEFSPDGKYVAVQHTPISDAQALYGYLTVIDLRDGSIARPLAASRITNCYKMHFSPNSKWLVRLSYDNEVLVLTDMATGQDRHDFGSKRYDFVAFSPEGDSMAMFDVKTNELVVMDILTGKELKGSKSPNKRTRGGLFSPDGSRLATGENKQVVIWNVAKRDVETIIKTDLNLDPSMGRFSPDGKLLALPGFGGEMKVWDMTTGVCRLTFAARERTLSNSAYPLRLSPDWRRLVQTDHLGNLRIWDLPPIN